LTGLWRFADADTKRRPLLPTPLSKNDNNRFGAVFNRFVEIYNRRQKTSATDRFMAVSDRFVGIYNRFMVVRFMVVGRSGKK